MYFLFYANSLSEQSSVLRIRGSDAYTYLQGQFTQDLNQPVGSSAYGMWLNQKGRVVADGWIFRIADNDFIAASFSTKAGILRQRLESYIVADDVEIVDETADWSWLKIWGERAADKFGAAFGSIPAAGCFLENGSGVSFRGRISSGENFEWLAPRAVAQTFADKLIASGATLTDSAAAERERIGSGIPAVPADLGPADLPGEGGLDDTGISYTKGCYLGQEVMARLKNLGQVRRRLHVVRAAGPPPPPQTALFQGGKKIGEIRSAAPDGDGFVAMAMLHLLNLDPAAGLGRTADGPSTLEIVRRV
jgi:folate-binding protein YgfZ